MSDREYIRELMMLHFGDDELPDELRRQVEADSELLKEWQGLQSLSQELPDEASFELSESERDDLSSAIEQEIDTTSNVESVPSPATPVWYKALAVAATLTLVIVGAWILERYDSGGEIAEAELADPYEYYVLESEAVQEATVSDPMYDALIYEYTSDVTAEPATMLLDDITEDEMNYLEDTFDVSELLL